MLSSYKLTFDTQIRYTLYMHANEETRCADYAINGSYISRKQNSTHIHTKCKKIKQPSQQQKLVSISDIIFSPKYRNIALQNFMRIV